MMSDIKNIKMIQIRFNIRNSDPLFEMFKCIKEKLGINANSEVIRYSIKKTYDNDVGAINK